MLSVLMLSELGARDLRLSGTPASIRVVRGGMQPSTLEWLMQWLDALSPSTHAMTALHTHMTGSTAVS